MTIVARPLPQGDNSRGASASPSPAPRVPAPDYLELCRREFLKRYFRQVNGDDYEFSHNVYEV